MQQYFIFHKNLEVNGSDHKFKLTERLDFFLVFYEAFMDLLHFFH